MEIFELATKENIWQFKQNKPSLIVEDLKEYVPEELVYNILLKRGVFKWFSARRKLIKLKNVWRDKVTFAIKAQKESTSAQEKAYWKGYRRGIEECRADLRAVCHGPRFEAPDNDKKAQKYLELLDNGGYIEE